MPEDAPEPHHPIAVRPLAELVLLSFALAGLWRAEVEWHGWHGWHGLIWLSYRHLAVATGAVLFLAWVARTPIVRATGRPWGLLGMALPYAAVTLFVYGEALKLEFQFLGPPYGLPVAVLTTLVWPFFAFGMGRATGHRLSWWLLLPSTLLVWFHLPIGSWWAGDTIHGVKSGAAVVPMVLGLGLPWVTRPPTSSTLD